MTEEEKAEKVALGFNDWNNRNAKWVHFQLSLGRVFEVLEKAYEEAYLAGLHEGQKELNAENRQLDTMLTGESLVSNERKEQLDKAKEIIRELSKYVSDSKWYIQHGFVELQKELVVKAEVFLKESKNEKD